MRFEAELGGSGELDPLVLRIETDVVLKANTCEMKIQPHFSGGRPHQGGGLNG
jgi:hypothetical protein